MTRALPVAVAVALSGCLQFSPADGALHCSTVGSKCPNGYFCAPDNTCWHNGHTPPADMTPEAPPDMLPMNMSCALPSDCPTPSQACLVPACIQATCGLVAAPQGTVPTSGQVAGDCQKHVCDASGNLTAMPDPTNKPTDPTGGCNTPGCNGSMPTMTPTASGTACTQTANGVCNGLGVCGVCKPGNVQCAADGKTIQTCSTAGQWVNGTVCRNACTNGACSGACSPSLDNPYCSGIDQLHTCSGTTWVTSTCTYACSGTPGACTGTCKPSAGSCAADNKTINSCDATGTPHSTVCANYCLNGACVDCAPGAVGCCTASTGYAGNYTCDATGHWPGTCNACTGGQYSSCSGGTCSCSAPNPCLAGDACGTRQDACGVTQYCGANGDGSCNAGYTCYYNSSLKLYKCKVQTTTGCAVCPCCGSCCGKYCC